MLIWPILLMKRQLLLQKHDQETVKVNDFEEARDKIMVGKEIKTIIMSDEEKTLTAYHEAGHALSAACHYRKKLSRFIKLPLFLVEEH